MISSASNRHHVNAQKFIETVIFNIRWALIPFFLGLAAVLAGYFVSYVTEIRRLLMEATHLTPSDYMVRALEVTDMVMTACLIVMIVSGSYNSYVSKDHKFPNFNIGSGQLKVKLTTALVVVTGIHILQTFMSHDPHPWEEIKKQLCIHLTFVFSAFMLQVGEFLHDYVHRPVNNSSTSSMEGSQNAH